MASDPTPPPPDRPADQRLPGVIQVHIDPLWAIARTFGSSISDQGFVYQHVISSLLDLLESFHLKITFFVIGQDLREEPNRLVVRRIAAAGHEIANHSYSHPIGFRHLSPSEKEREIGEAEKAIADVCGVAPAGFAAPAYDLDGVTLRILEDRGYLYDTSLYPSYFSFFAKTYRHLKSILISRAGTPSIKPSSWGSLSYMFAPRRPFHPSPDNPRRRGGLRILEVPFSSLPVFGLPFYNYFCLFAGEWYFRLGLSLFRFCRRPLNYLIHPTELIDPDLLLQNQAQHIPIPTVAKSYEYKRGFLERVLSGITSRYRIGTLKDFAAGFPPAK